MSSRPGGAVGDPAFRRDIQAAIAGVTEARMPVTTDGVLAALLRKHPAYNRKPAPLLRKAVVSAVEAYRSAALAGEGGAGDTLEDGGGAAESAAATAAAAPPVSLYSALSSLAEDTASMVLDEHGVPIGTTAAAASTGGDGAAGAGLSAAEGEAGAVPATSKAQEEEASEAPVRAPPAKRRKRTTPSVDAADAAAAAGRRKAALPPGTVNPILLAAVNGGMPGAGGAGGGMSGGGGPGGMAAFELPPYVRPTERYNSLGGLAGILKDIRETVEYPLTHPEIYTHLGVEPPRGVLLHGPAGCGKTLLARAIAGELGVYFRSITGPEVVGGVSGESEARLRYVFDDAIANAPSLVFIDEIDAIAPRREGNARGMERRIVAQLLSCMDGLSLDRTGGKAVMVLGATSRPEGLDPGLRRAGRFDREIGIPIPDEKARREILDVLVKRMRLAPESSGEGEGGEGEGAAAVSSSAAAAAPTLDLAALARATPGYVGADLVALTKEAAVEAVNRAFKPLLADAVAAAAAEKAATAAAAAAAADAAAAEASSSAMVDEETTAAPPVEPAPAPPTPPSSSAPAAPPSDESYISALLRELGPLPPDKLAPLYVTHGDFVAALPKVQPSATREGFATVPNVTWTDVGALAEVRSELEMSIVQPLRRPELFASLGLKVPAGVLLYGPPGCGKTLLAKAVANETCANFISVKGPELLDKYVGESERAVRQVFQRARASAPCIIFFDECDSLAPRRGGPGSGAGGNVTERVVNQLLTELDGLDARRDVFVLAATNRPDIIDPAMLRPGRLDKLLYVPLPTPEERVLILGTHTRRTPLAPDVDLGAIGRDPRCARFSGADLSGLVREASMIALKERLFGAGKLATNTSTAAGAADSVPSASAGEAPVLVHARHFEAALGRVLPSVSPADERLYNAMQAKLRASRGHIPGSGAGSTSGGAGGAAGEAPTPRADL